jgi:hypothetical protein
MMDKRIIDVATEDRFAVLEKKMSDMEAHVKGLTQELVDLKSFAKKMSRQIEERDRQELRGGPTVHGQQAQASVRGGTVFPSSPGTVMMRKDTGTAVAPAGPVMDNILQPDGTIEKEPRRGDKKPIVASPGVERGRKGASARARQSDLIIAVEKKDEEPAKK